MSDEQDKNESEAADAAGRSASGESAESGSEDLVAAGAVRPSGKRKADAGGSDAAKVVKPTVRRGSSEQNHVSRNPITRILTFLREVVAEMRKVIWPTKNEMVTYTIVVLIFIVSVVSLTTGLDVGFGKAVTVIFG